MKEAAENMLFTLQVFYMQKFMTVLKHPDSSYFLLNSDLPDVYYISYAKGYLSGFALGRQIFSENKVSLMI